MPPAGYVSLGYVAFDAADEKTSSYPLKKIYKCIREDQCRQGKIGMKLWTCKGSDPFGKPGEHAVLYKIECTADLFCAQPNLNPPNLTVFVP